mgnify:CR=1 FL=1
MEAAFVHRLPPEVRVRVRGRVRVGVKLPPEATKQREP